MSKELTEQWKNETLETSYYYFKTSTGVVVGFHLKGFKYPYTWRGTTMDDVSKVLAPVPEYNQFVELTEKIEALEKRLDVAKKALKEIIRTKRDFDDDPMNKIGFLAWGRLHDIEKISKQALKEIKEVK